MVLLVALPQLVALPLVAALCNIPRVDCRWVLACGLCLCAGACLSFSQLTADWVREDFYLPMLLLVVGQPMAVIPLLMLSTSVIAPIEGPFASAWFNTVRGFSGVVATAVIGALGTAREHYHSNRLVDHLGNAPQAVELRLQQIAGLQPKRRLRRALAAPGRTGPPTGPGAGQRRRAAGDGRPGLRPADPDSDPAATGLPAPPGRSHTLKGRCMSFITSRKGSLLLAALLVLTLLVYLLFHLLAPRVVQSTDDAYVHADFTLVAPKVAGFVQDVLVEDNQPVKAGQLLARLDDRDFRTALAAAEADVLGAEANLANAEANLQRQQALIEQARAKVRAEQAELVFARHEQSRYQTLASKGAGSLQNAQQAQSRIDTASARLAEGQAAVDATRKQVSVLEARVGQARGDLQRMQARRDQARLDLSYCELRAPFDGQVGRRQLRVGAYVTPGSALLAVVPLQQAYVVGNFQETQLTHVSPGQAVEIRVDTFPGKVLRGHVDSIAPATGLSFAPIAPDNATGNFTKVVQRIPVKIVLEPRQAMAGKLRMGMSVEARIDTATGTRSAEVAQQ